MTFYFSSFFIHVIQAVPHKKYRRAKLLNFIVYIRRKCFCDACKIKDAPNSIIVIT